MTTKKPSFGEKARMKSAKFDLSIDELEKKLKDNALLSRVALLSLSGFVLFLSTTAFNTTHRDLLLNTAVKLPIGIAELPRDWVFGVGAILLVLVQ